MSFAKGLISYLSKLKEEGKIKYADLQVYYELPFKLPRKTQILCEGCENIDGEIALDSYKAREEMLLDTLPFQAKSIYTIFVPTKKLHPLLKESPIHVKINNERKVNVEVETSDDPKTLEEYAKREGAEKEVKDLISNILREAGYSEYRIRVPSREGAKILLEELRARAKS